MEYRRLGKTGLQVSALSLGSWLTFGKQIGDDVAEQLMVKAYELGVNFFDNAEIYARGQSEIVMGKILNKLNWDRSSYLVSSKVFFGSGGKLPNQTGLNRKHIMEACEASLKRLQVEYIDLYFCHRPDPITPIEETVWAMNHLIQQGKILYWGTSEWSAASILEAHRIAKDLRLIGPVMEQPEYNMFHRQRFEKEYAELYDSVGLGTTIWSPLASGVLTGKYLNGFPEDTRLGMTGLEWLKNSSLTEERLVKVRQLKQLADELNTSLPKLALAWCLKNPNVSTVILGASKVHHLEENLASSELLAVLTEEVMGRIEGIIG
ncbi:MAG TPA: aldo/keto reductase [Saprospiraceae bacterium]|nr:aldo/keto reductase [Saprospiraceae bacterium]HMQ83251.1 aldo/keto reductase [Saprospiraceae bacterium]